MSPSYISIIVSTYNRPDALKLVLLALAEQNIQPNTFEVIVADDGSNQDTKNLVDNLSPNLPYPLHHVWHEDTGFRLATIRNKAAAQAKGDYLIFLDGDCIPLISFVYRHKLLAEKKYFVAGNRILLSQGFTKKVVSQPEEDIHKKTFWEWFLICNQKNCNKFLAFLYIPLQNIRKLRATKWQGARGCNLAVWKEDLIAINGFDESYTGWGYEDSDLIIRLMRKGILRKDGHFAVPVLHLFHQDNNKLNERANLERLAVIKNSNEIRAKKGIDQYI
jgi:glycosyltransferase involved in cell wall biosynthesis